MKARTVAVLTDARQTLIVKAIDIVTLMDGALVRQDVESSMLQETAISMKATTEGVPTDVGVARNVQELDIAQGTDGAMDPPFAKLESRHINWNAGLTRVKIEGVLTDAIAAASAPVADIVVDTVGAMDIQDVEKVVSLF